jgi:UDP-N-acetylmuramoylalanine--D-glutamate ligase
VHAALAGRPVLVQGLGSFGGGAAVVRYLCRRGARVTATDLRGPADLEDALARIRDLPVRLVLGEHRVEDFERAALVVANPAVPPHDRHLAAARAAGVPITSEMELFLEAAPARLVGVTGTQGKSSTARMCADLLRAAGFAARLGGNIGHSLLEDLDALSPDDVAVVEISSYQLEALADGGPAAGRMEAVCIVNVLADHLERHGSVAAYLAAKLRMLELVAEHGVALVPSDDRRLAEAPLARGRRVLFRPREAPGAEDGAALWIEGGRFRCGDLTLGRTADLGVPGRFQRGNCLAALGLARALGASPERLAAAVPHLRGLQHRMQDLGVRAGHRVIDNGVSTTPDSTVSALAERARPCVLLCGGATKRLPLDELARVARGTVSLALCFGRGGAEFASAFAAAGVPSIAVPGVRDALRLAFERAVEGEDILFSPAAASFDAYLNFEERARDFRAALALLAGPFEGAGPAP